MGLFCRPYLFSSLLILSATFVNCGFLEAIFSYDPSKDLSLAHPDYKDLQFPRNDKLRFFLYPDSGHVHYKEEIIVGDSTTLKNYNPNVPPIIIIHGFLQNYKNKHPQQLKNAYLRTKYPANIIMVDWRKVSQPKYGHTLNLALGFPLAIKYVDSFSKQISDLVMYLVHNGLVPDPSYVHVIGFSLGGQIAGVVGSAVQKATRGQKIGRITALDPAGQSYHLKLNQEYKLDRSDAEFVDVVHTSIVKYGYILPVGHVDYYPNGGGPFQPNCKVPIDSQKDLPGLPGSCSHARSWDYFTSSVYKNDIIACKDVTYGGYKTKNVCDSPITFGQYVPQSARGVYFFDAVIHD